MTVNRSSLKYHKVTFLLHHLGVHPPLNVSCCIFQVPLQPSLGQACWSNPYEIPQLTFRCFILLLSRLLLEPQYVNHLTICIAIMNFVFLLNVIELAALTFTWILWSLKWINFHYVSKQRTYSKLFSFLYHLISWPIGTSKTFYCKMFNAFITPINVNLQANTPYE